MTLTVLAGDEERTVPSEGLVLEADALLDATGWEMKPHGLCRGDVCVPVPLTAPVSLAEVAAALGRPLATAELTDRVVAVLGEPVGAGAGEQVLGLQLADVDGNPLALGAPGRKTAIVAWSTWCGCRYELPSWKQLADDLSAQGLDVVTVALDEDPDAVRPWVQDGLPTAVDPEHRLSDVFGISHVPSTVWLDEDGRVVKPPTLSPGDDQFQEFTQVESERHHEALRRWVTEGELPDVAPPADSVEVRAARAERRLAAWLHRHGHTELAEEHFRAAVDLAPLDFSIRRGSMPLRGQDPFGAEFFELWEEWSAAGRPGYDSL
jgi:hypothetical protein